MPSANRGGSALCEKIVTNQSDINNHLHQPRRNHRFRSTNTPAHIEVSFQSTSDPKNRIPSREILRRRRHHQARIPQREVRFGRRK